MKITTACLGKTSLYAMETMISVVYMHRLYQRCPARCPWLWSPLLLPKIHLAKCTRKIYCDSR